MADSKDETGKGASRPYATIDLKATEVGGTRRAGAGDKAARWFWGNPLAGRLGLLRRRALTLSRHVGAGLAGGLLALIAWLLLAGGRDGEPRATGELAALNRRLAQLEQVVVGDAAAPGFASRIDALARSSNTLESTTGRLGTELKAVKEQGGGKAAAELGERLARLENAITALSVSTGGEANEVVRTGLDRFERGIAGAKADAGRLAERLDRSEQQLRALQAAVENLKADLERGLQGAARAADLPPLAGRVAALDKELVGFIKTEADRSANGSRVVLALELSNLKRAIERGSGFAAELAAAKSVAGDKLNLARFDRYANEGLPPLSELTASFRKVANAMLDAENEPADAPFFERMLAGARSIVRIRKLGHSAEDDSLEATIARMETALKENRLGDVIAYAKKLPPKAALAGEDWLNRVEMRYSVEQALAATEAALKNSLAASPAAADRRQ